MLQSRWSCNDNSVRYVATRDSELDGVYSCDIEVEARSGRHDGRWTCRVNVGINSFSDSVNVTVNESGLPKSDRLLIGVTLTLSLLLLIISVALVIVCCCPTLCSCLYCRRTETR